MDKGTRTKTLRCRIGSHRWVTRTDAGARWQECGRCGTYSHKVVAANRYPPGDIGDSGAGGA